MNDLDAKKLSKKRKRTIRKLLEYELQLVQHYRCLIEDEAIRDKKELAYKTKVVDASDKLASKLDAERKRFMYYAFLAGEYNSIAVCDKLNISERTYYNWRLYILTKFGQMLGVE